MFALIAVAGAFVVGAVCFGYGKQYGQALEQNIVARSLALYRRDVGAVDAKVGAVLLYLPSAYRRAFRAVVDEVDQIAVDAKKAL